MSQNLRCSDCLMLFDSEEALARHKSKFCTNSKYASLDSLQQQFQKAQQGKDISLYGRPKLVEKGLSYNLNSQKPQFDFQKDRQYRELLRQIEGREDLKQKLNRQKMNAQQQLAMLENKEKQLVFQTKKQQLGNVLKKREQLALQEELLQRQIRNFQKQVKQQAMSNQNNSQDFGFREGRQAGKLAMQRRMLEQKKRDIENNLKLKKREEQKVNQQLQNISEQPIFIPDYRKKPVPKDPQRMRTQPTKVHNFQQSKLHQSSFKKQPIPPPKKYPNNDVELSPKDNIRPIPKKAPIIQQKPIQQPPTGQQEYPFLKASRFTGQQKTLFQSLNPKGKSDQDIFIESLVAQEYDALNVLAKIPKDSQLYQAKLKQFQEMSKIRQQLKQKVQRVRLEKVRRQFQLDKEMTQTEKNNLKWLDKNRQNMLKKEVNILNNQHNQQSGLNNSQNFPGQQPYNGMNQLPSKTSNNSPIFQNLPSGNNLRPQSRATGPKMYRIILKSLRNYSNKNPVCIRAILTEEADASPISIFTTKYHDESAPKDDRNPYNPGVKNRFDESGDVVYNQSFQVKEDLQSRYNSRQEELYLWLLVMEKDPLKISNEPQVYIWYCFKLTHFGQLREGTFTLSLFHDQIRYPQPLDMNKMRSKAAQQLVIQLAQDIQRAKPQNGGQKWGSDDRIGTGGSATSIRNKAKSNRRKKSMRAQTIKKSNSVQNIKQQFFIQNEQKSQFEQISINQEIDLDFTVIAARTMPSYTGPIKVQVSFIDYRNRSLFAPQEALAQYGSDMYNPHINFTFSIKKEAIPPSCVAVIKIMGLSTLNYTPGLLGYGYFHLCFDQEGLALQNDTKKQYFLISGLFQVPVYWGDCNSYIKTQQIQNIPTIPCFSLLISVSTSLNEDQFPEYQQGVYNTIFFQVQDLQYQLFSQQMKRQRLSTKEYVNAYFKFKGVNVQKFGQNDLAKLISQSLAFNQQNLASLFVLHAMAEYSPTFGAVLGIDLLSLPTDEANNYYYFCTVCLYPPATFYNRGPTDLNFFYQIDLGNSLTHQLTFMDQVVNYFPEYKINTLIIIEVSRVKLSSNGQPQSQVQTFGNITVPFFDIEEKVPCINVGPHRLKLKAGGFESSSLKLIENNFVRFIQLEQNKKKTEIELQIRLMNGYFSSQFRRAGGVNKGKPLRSIFQNSKGFKQSQQKVKRIIEDTYSTKLQ